MSEWRTKWRERLPLGFYGTLTIGGMIFIMTAKTLEWNSWIVTLVPIILMATYFVACVGILKGLRLHNEQAGDNLYYMGFLFTLTSLGASLFRFSAGASVDDIVQNFGVAVSSTIVGVTLRIFFNQMRRDPLDVDRTARHELTEMTRRVKTELNSSAREFSSYRRISNQMLTEGFEEIARQAERNGEAVLKSIEAMTKDAIRPIQEAAERLSAIVETNNRMVEERAKANVDMADAALARLDATASRLAEIVTAFGSQVETTGQRLTGMRLPEEVIKLELQPVLAAVTDLGQLQARRLEEAAGHTADQAERLKEALAPLIDMPDRIEGSLRPLNNLAANLEHAFRPLNDLPSRFDTSMKAVDSLGPTIERALKPLAKTAEKIDQSVGSLQVAVRQVDESAKAAGRLDHNTEKLEEVVRRVDESARALPIYGAAVMQPVAEEQQMSTHTNTLPNMIPPNGEDRIELGSVLSDLAIPDSSLSKPVFSEPVVAAVGEEHAQNTEQKWWRRWQ
ncbi:hypothetical protein [Rhizobium laguerreae]|uniref:hypothetical protein n=1 Tax=Rhizobium laguerreae TaxID=1076926 RepID=UPI001C9172EE|nr:hypothetical protein [Rhizobium laguerreae]MBY3342885.1 hypothetical protein [Rhizobium laguerreae]MBY3349919.1 hypothetical protein [Rhizobium laguerreae]MBY3371023.1 hypothetical protein [Rhizobium laguerreae]MBY3426263.1 hypothetical protein [Rhizobium laguerreae]MBY3434185.1 hypothetical protein [Rhizobium laguerreae]